MSSLFVDRRGIEIEVKVEALVFREKGKRVGKVPIAPLERVVLRGDVTLKTSVLGRLAATIMDQHLQAFTASDGKEVGNRCACWPHT